MEREQLVARADPAGLTVRGARVTRVGAALVGGQLGGLAFAVFLMGVVARVMGRPPVYALHVMGALFLGPKALEHPSVGTAALGLLANQLGPALFWSLVYAAVMLTAKVRPGLNEALMLGFLIGGVAELVDVSGLMPLFQHALHGTNLWTRAIPRGWHWLAHFAYGLALGGGYWLAREQLERAWISRRAVRPRG